MKLKHLSIYTVIFLVLAGTTVFTLQNLTKGNTGENTVKESTPKTMVQPKYEELPLAKNEKRDDEKEASHEGMQMDGMSEGKMHEEMSAQIETSVKFTNNALIVTNGENSDLTNCTFELNQTVVQRGYVYAQDVIPAKGTVTASWDKFERAGVAFNTATRKPQNIIIMCDNGWSYLSNR